ncbi:hypothetical protein FGG08_006084 [Glutinoglossum americanum]|uniref:J domain-containing protein n=1 Tax=Glutinoglossum americanum TaxID=1670608 RepID=A0A9P8L2A3_9PEZI|nr:hypothetical protein FGG08_006084 [Glutinoglossum americanum]
MPRILPLSRFFTRSNGQFAIPLSHAVWARRPSLPASSPADELPRSYSESRSPRNFYEIFPRSLSFGPPPRGPFSVNLQQLREEFLQLQQNAHPDRHPPEVKHRAEAASAYINEAYKTLRDPLLRAQHLLSLRGFDVACDETAKIDDPELLMEVMETREEIEAVEEEEQLLPLMKTNNARIDESVRVLENAFREDDMKVAKEEAVKLRYWINIRESLAAWEKGKPITLVH